MSYCLNMLTSPIKSCCAFNITLIKWSDSFMSLNLRYTRSWLIWFISYIFKFKPLCDAYKENIVEVVSNLLGIPKNSSIFNVLIGGYLAVTDIDIVDWHHIAAWFVEVDVRTLRMLGQNLLTWDQCESGDPIRRELTSKSPSLDTFIDVVRVEYYVILLKLQLLQLLILSYRR